MLSLRLLVLGALVALGRVNGRQPAADVYKTLEDVYGTQTNSQLIMQQEHRVSLFQRMRAADADSDSCDAAFDIMILQDATGSFEVDYAITVNVTLPTLKKRLDEVSPNSTYSLVSFRDKPIPPLGEPTDDCFTVQNLNVNDPLDFMDFFVDDIPTGGRDFPENQFGALVAVMNSPKTIPWHTDKNRIPVIFLVTDAPPHFEGDGSHPDSGTLDAFGDELYDESKRDEYCTKRYYPSATVVRDLLLNKHLYLGVVVPRADYQPGKALATWQWFNGYVGYPPEFTQAASDETGGWIEDLLSLMKQIYAEHCQGLPTFFPTWTPDATTLPTPKPRPFPLPSISLATPSTTGVLTTTEELPASTTAPRTTTLPPATELIPTTTTMERLTTPVAETTECTGNCNIRPPQSTATTTTTEPNLPTNPPENSTRNCECLSQPDGPLSPCCHRQPEVLIALMKQPEELDIHFRGGHFHPIQGAAIPAADAQS